MSFFLIVFENGKSNMLPLYVSFVKSAHHPSQTCCGFIFLVSPIPATLLIIHQLHVWGWCHLCEHCTDQVHPLGKRILCQCRRKILLHIHYAPLLLHAETPLKFKSSPLESLDPVVAVYLWSSRQIDSKWIIQSIYVCSGSPPRNKWIMKDDADVVWKHSAEGMRLILK